MVWTGSFASIGYVRRGKIILLPACKPLSKARVKTDKEKNMAVSL